MEEKRTGIFTDNESDILLKTVGSTPRPQPYRLSPYLYSLGAYNGVIEPRGASFVTNRILREIPSKNPIVAATIRHRQNQVSRFGRRPSFEGDTGFRIRLRDLEREPTPQEKHRIREIEEILQWGGVFSKNSLTGEEGVWNSEQSEKAMTFQEFLRTITWDSLILDGAAYNIEVGQNAKKWPVVWFKPVDAGLIHKVMGKNYGKDARPNPSVGPYGSIAYKPEVRPNLISPSYVMTDPQGYGVLREYAWDELGYMVRNPRTDAWVMGYGYSELEMLVDIVIGILYGIRFNTEYFDSNHMPEGILSLQGQYSTEEIEGLRRQLRLMIGGLGQFWQVPILASEEGSGAQFMKIRDDPSQGMYWREWLLFCATIVCAVYQMDSSEINFVNFGVSQNALANPTPLGKIQYSQETGLSALLTAIQYNIDFHIIRRFNDGEFELTFTGISQKDVSQEALGRTSRMQFALSTPNEERARNDQLPIYDPLDLELWEKIKSEVRQEFEPILLDSNSIVEETKKRYLQQGGHLAQWPNAPIGNPLAFQAWTQEHQLGNPFGVMANQPSNPNEQPVKSNEQPPEPENENQQPNIILGGQIPGFASDGTPLPPKGK